MKEVIKPLTSYIKVLEQDKAILEVESRNLRILLELIKYDMETLYIRKNSFMGTIIDLRDIFYDEHKTIKRDKLTPDELFEYIREILITSLDKMFEEDDRRDKNKDGFLKQVYIEGPPEFQSYYKDNYRLFDNLDRFQNDKRST
jgi:hypothetical protein